MKKILISLLMFTTLFTLAGCYDDDDNNTDTYEFLEYDEWIKTYEGEKTVIKITFAGMSAGTMEIELYNDLAPTTVSNLLALINSGYYDFTYDDSTGSVEDAYDIGDTLIKYNYISSISSNNIFVGAVYDPDGVTNYNPATITGEFYNNNAFENNLSLTRGVVAMNRNTGYDTGSSEFFVVGGDYSAQNGNYAAFGYVTSDLMFVDEIRIAGTSNHTWISNIEVVVS